MINRPEALNAMTPEMYADLSKAWIDVRDNPDVYVAVVTGAPQPERTTERQVFTAGADLKLTIPAKNPMRDLWQTQQDQILNRGLEVWKPVVAAVNGLCLAGGMTLLMACDFRIGFEHSMYDLSEVKRGILPGNGGTQRTTRQLPYPIAMEVLLLGRRLTAERAAQFGLINEVVPHDEVMSVAMDYARQLREMPPLAVPAIKELAVRAHQGLPLTERPPPGGRNGPHPQADRGRPRGHDRLRWKRPPEFQGQ